MKNKIGNKLLGVLMVATTIISTLFAFSSTVYASDLVLNEVTGYSYTGVSPHLGYAITHDPLFIMKDDGKVVFYVEPVIFTTSGGGFLNYVANNGKAYIYELAESFSKEKSGGILVNYPNSIAISINGGKRYNYGN